MSDYGLLIQGIQVILDHAEVVEAEVVMMTFTSLTHDPRVCETYQGFETFLLYTESFHNCLSTVHNFIIISFSTVLSSCIFNLFFVDVCIVGALY